MPFPRKRLMFEQVGVDQGLLDQLDDLKKFLRGIDDTSPTWLKDAGSAGKAFMPKFSGLYSMKVLPDGMEFGKSVSRSDNGKTYNFYKVNDGLLGKNKKEIINAIFKVNVPGFVYRQHFRGAFNSGPEYAVFVGHFDAKPTKATAEAMNWVCLFRSRGTGTYAEESPANNHANNFFPINPGGNTYILVITTGKFFNATAAERQSLMYVPAFGYTGHPITYIGAWGTKKNTSGSIGVGNGLDALKEAFK